MFNGGTTTMTQTLITGNAASNGGASIQFVAGIVYYALPAAPGHWLPNSECIANREACLVGDQTCLNAYAQCAVTSGDASNNWTPSGCNPPIFIQTCEWQTDACGA